MKKKWLAVLGIVLVLAIAFLSGGEEAAVEEGEEDDGYVTLVNVRENAFVNVFDCVMYILF